MTTEKPPRRIHGLASTERLDDGRALEFTELILPRQANHYGTLFGPNAMALLGKAAFLVAARFTRQPVVMASARQVEFLAPIPVGSLLNFRARVTRVGTASMSVQVAATFDDAPGAGLREALRAAFEMVAVDGHGRPCAVSVPSRVQARSFTAPASL